MNSRKRVFIKGQENDKIYFYRKTTSFKYLLMKILMGSIEFLDQLFPIINDLG